MNKSIRSGKAQARLPNADISNNFPERYPWVTAGRNTRPAEKVSGYNLLFRPVNIQRLFLSINNGVVDHAFLHICK